jgi:hypothetical protein
MTPYGIIFYVGGINMLPIKIDFQRMINPLMIFLKQLGRYLLKEAEN